MPSETLLNRYRLDTRLGQGGMGAVYHGYDLLLKRTVPIQVLSKTGLGTTGRSRLLAEAQASEQKQPEQAYACLTQAAALAEPSEIYLLRRDEECRSL